MLVHEFLTTKASLSPEKIALVCGGRRLTYAEIDEQSNRLANALRSYVVTRGDRVVIFLNNSIESVVSIFGVLKAGAVFVVVNRSMKEDKLLYVLANCRAASMICDGRSLGEGVVSRVLGASDSLKVVLICGERNGGASDPYERCANFDACLAEAGPLPPPQVNIDLDLACLIYTSGTTGEPKGVMSDHSNMVFAAESIIKYLGNVESDIVLNVLPLSFDYGLYQLLMTFRFGGTLVLERSFAFPAEILKRIGEERVTGLPGVPTIFAILLRMDLTGWDLSSLRYVTNTAAALHPNHIRDLRAKLPMATVYSMYGLTETKRTLYLPPEWLDKKPGSVGVAIPGTEVWIEDDNGDRLGPDQVGELIVRGRHVMRGYWEAPEASAARYRTCPATGERVCRTGDLFRMDEDGFMYFVGRRDDIIKSRGEKVAPREVEQVLLALSGVRDAAVIGVPDTVLGQSIKAFIVTDGDSLDETRVLAHCRANLEDYMVPKAVEFLSELPVTSSGKVTKKTLR